MYVDDKKKKNHKKKHEKSTTYKIKYAEGLNNINLSNVNIP